jgi:Putative peptidoglycan binding domain
MGMRFYASLAALVVLFSALSLPAQAAHKHRGPTATHHAKGASASKKLHGRHQLHGQRQIDSGRATEIQAALIRAHYLDGEPTGQWDATTEAAMRKMQADNGWQTKITPDSRALIKLGLGPNHSSDLGASSVSMLNSSSATATNAPAIGSNTQNRTQNR